jgi:hypothetical protein
MTVRTMVILCIAALAGGCASFDVRMPSRCALGICILYTDLARDSDGDGFPDIDERAAGSDPFDAGSRPSVLALTDAISGFRLPSFNRGMSEIVVLPTKSPQGADLVPVGWLPARKSLLDQMGFSADLLKAFGLSADGGFRMQIDLPALGAATPAFGVLVGGVDMALISDGGSPDEGMRNRLSAGLDPLGSHRATGEAKSTYSQLSDGWQLDVTWNDGWSAATKIAKDGSKTQWLTDANLTRGYKTETEPEVTQKNADGTVLTHQSSTETNYRTGKVTKTEEDRTEKQLPGGGTQTTTIVKTTTRDKDGKVTAVVIDTTVRNTDKQGKSTTTSTTQTCDSAGKNCKASDQSASHEDFYDPEQRTVLIIPSAKDMARLLAVVKGGNTTPRQTQDRQPFGKDAVARLGGLNPLIILVDPDHPAELGFRTRPRITGAQPETVGERP